MEFTDIFVSESVGLGFMLGITLVVCLDALSSIISLVIDLVRRKLGLPNWRWAVIDNRKIEKQDP